MRVVSVATRSKPRRYQAASRRCARARLVCASMTGERRAQLVRRVGGELELALAGALDGAATRRPTATAPRKTTRRRTPPMRSSARRIVPRACSTASRACPTTTWPVPTSAPGRRISVPSMTIVAVPARARGLGRQVDASRRPS